MVECARDCVCVAEIAYTGLVLALRWSSMDPSVQDDSMGALLHGNMVRLCVFACLTCPPASLHVCAHCRRGTLTSSERRCPDPCPPPSMCSTPTWRGTLAIRCTPPAAPFFFSGWTHVPPSPLSRMQMTGRIPIRGGTYDPRFPTNSSANWLGYLPFSDNPWTLDPRTLSPPLIAPLLCVARWHDHTDTRACTHKPTAGIWLTFCLRLCAHVCVLQRRVSWSLPTTKPCQSASPL